MLSLRRTLHRAWRPVIGSIAAIGLACGAVAAEDAKDYSLSIDGTEIGINVDETVTATTKSGASVALKLTRRPFAVFKSARASFEYPSGLSVASTSIDKDIRQHLLATATGTLIIVQEYATLDPAPLAQLMVNQMTKDDVAGGSKLSSEPASRSLPDGTELAGMKASVTKKSESAALEVLGYGKANQGVLVITRIDADSVAKDQPIIDRLWSTLKILPVAE
jgi:hypothetical protein